MAVERRITVTKHKNGPKQRAKHDRVAAAAEGESASDVVDVIRMLPQRYVERFPLVDLEDYPGNPKEHDIGLLHESIDASGFYGVLLVQDWPKTPRYILAGHGRKDTLIAKGVTHVPVLFVKCDAKTARRIVLVDNRATERGGMDDNRLARFLVDLARADDLLGTGYDIDDATSLLEKLGQPLSLLDASIPLPPEGEIGAANNAVEGDVSADTSPQRFVMFSRDRVLEEAFAYFRARGFPYRALPLHMQLQEMNRLAAIDDEESAMKSTYGYHVADTYHPHRLHATAQGKRSPFDSFHIDASLKHALELELDASNRINDKLFASLMIVRGTQACSNFKPGYAMALYRRFAKKGETVLDPCTGYGGRLVGWLASRLGGTYIGVDPNVPTHQGNTKLAEALAQKSQRVELHNAPFEDVATSIARASSVGFAFTSPPYFAKEMYSDADTQSWVRYKTIDEWVAGFLNPMLAGCLRALKPERYCVINIADVKIGSTTYPLEQLTVETGLAVGFEHVDTLRFEYGFASRIGKGDQEAPIEPAFVFRKPAKR